MLTLLPRWQAFPLVASQCGLPLSSFGTEINLRDTVSQGKFPSP